MNGEVKANTEQIWDLPKFWAKCETFFLTSLHLKTSNITYLCSKITKNKS